MSYRVQIQKGLQTHTENGRPLRRLLIAALLVVALATPVAAQQQVEATVQDFNGRVEMRSGPGAAWSAVETGMRLPLGATVSTGFGASAELEIGPAILEVRPLSRLTIEELIEREGLVESELFLQVGRVRAEVRTNTGRQSDFRLRSPVATAAVRGTSFEFDGVNLDVETGTVRIANQNGEGSNVGAGESSSSDENTPPTPPSEEFELATVVQIFVAPPGEIRTEGVRGGVTGSETGSIEVNWETETEIVIP